MVATPETTLSAQGRRSGDEPYLFVIDGLPKGYEWTDLKDLARKEADHAIWAHVQRHPDGTTSGSGWIRVHHSENAPRLYNGLCNELLDGRRLRVHLFDLNYTPARKLVCTCDQRLQCTRYQPAQISEEVARRSANSSWAGATGQSRPAMHTDNQPRFPPTPAQAPTAVRVMPNVQSITAGMSNMQVDSQAPISEALVKLCRNLCHSDSNVVQAAKEQYNVWLSRCSPTQASQLLQKTQNIVRAIRAKEGTTPTPLYLATSAGTPVNASQGVVRTEIRGVFVSGVDFKLTSRDVKEYFARAGTVTRCEVHKDAASGKSKGHATVQYASCDEAIKAVRLFDSEKLKGMRLKVRLDKEAVAVASSAGTSSVDASLTSAHGTKTSLRRLDSNAGPIIANGSVCART